MKVRFFNIQWDTTDDDFPDGNPDVSLPAEITCEVEDDLDVAYEGADVLSDREGWCVFGFEYEIIG